MGAPLSLTPLGPEESPSPGAPPDCELLPDGSFPFPFHCTEAPIRFGAKLNRTQNAGMREARAGPTAYSGTPAREGRAVEDVGSGAQHVTGAHSPRKHSPGTGAGGGLGVSSST